MSETHNLIGMLTLINEQCANKQRVSVNDVLEVIGRRSFGPLLVLVGIILSTPIIGDIPGVPTVFGLLVILIAIQLVVGRRHIWIPDFMLKQNVSRNSLQKTIAWAKVPARYIDSFIKPRLNQFTGQPVSYIISLVAILLSLATPAMELVPFSANLAGAIFLLFGLSLIAKDGLLALMGFIITALLASLLLYFVL